MQRGRSAFILAIVCSALATACGGGHGGPLEPRFVAVHNALSASGHSQSGPISEGKLREGEEARIDVQLTAGRCYTFVALGTSGVDDIGLQVVDASNESVARDRSTDRQAALQFCPRRSGDYQLVVTMASGRGQYIASMWEAAGGAGGRGGAPGSVAGTCADPLPLIVGEVVQGTTAGGAATMTSPCAQGNAPEAVYQLVVERPAQYVMELESAFDGVLYVLRTCGQPATALACNDDYQDTAHSRVDVTLQPGTYYVVVDGYGDAQGEFNLLVQATELRPIGEICGAAQPLPVGRPVNGSTAGSSNYFQATCAGGASSPDQVFRLDVPQRSRVRIHQRSQHDGALHMRRSCEDASTEIACNDDFGGVAESLLTEVVDEGRYYVISDGFSGGSQMQAGDFSLTAELAPVAGGGATADSCSTAGAITAGQSVELDTFEAADDLRGSCGGAEAADVVYRLDVPSRSNARFIVNGAQFAGHVYVRRACDDEGSEVACGEFPMAAGANQVALETILTPGSYHVVVDGRAASAFGKATLDVQLMDIRALERACRSAPLLRPGRTVNGSTSGRPNQFEASCAGQAQSGDVVYRIRVPSRQRVTVSMTSDYDGALHLRRDCLDRASEVACNDDHQDQQSSRIEAELDPGTYYLIVDGFQANNTGSYSVEYTATSVR